LPKTPAHNALKKLWSMVLLATDGVAGQSEPVRRPRVYSIAPGAPFLETLVEALLSGAICGGPIDLGTAVIYVPTRRAALALSQLLVRRATAISMLLPKIVPLGALDEESDNLIDDELVADADLEETILPAIGTIERRMILTRMILEWARAVRHAIRFVDSSGRRQTDTTEMLLVATTPIDAFSLSNDLARLIDELIIEDIAWDRLKPLCLSAFDDYWRITLDFLNIAMSSWPNVLLERACIDRAQRHVILIEREIIRLRQRGGPIIAAGSTGTNQATARLLAAISRAPNGAVVLPGLDMDLDAGSWQMIGEIGPGKETFATHPQAALRRLLPVLGITRDAVMRIGPRPTPRLRFVAEAMRPAVATATWRAFIDRQGPAIATALDNVIMIEAADEREEALALAIALREVLQTPGKIGALITPDRALAERVRVELKRWAIDVEDSGGTPLTRTTAGAFARLILAFATSRSAADLLALVAHPSTRLGLPAAATVRLVDAFEIGIIRPQVPLRNLENIRALVDAAQALVSEPHAHPSQRRISAATWGALADYLELLRGALLPLNSISGPAPLAQWLAVHRLTYANLSALSPEPASSAALGQSELAILFDLLADSAGVAIELDAVEYAALFAATARETRVQNRADAHPRLAILGLLEARLLRFDVAMLGGLDETIWPPQTDSDAFLNRPMRLELGLTPPERRIGQTAHDFVALLGSPRVLISRALKRGGTPTVASRFVRRLAALAGEPVWATRRRAGDAYLALARAIDTPAVARRVKRPEPRPPVHLRPKALSVTRIETLRRDPYSIFAEKILRLVPLEPIGATPGPREIGTLLHGVVAEVIRHTPALQFSRAALASVLDVARAHFAPLLADPGFRAFRWPAIERTLAAFVDWENGRRLLRKAVFVEERGELAIRLSDQSMFRLSATADRLELLDDGSLAVVDFKTGSPPSNREVIAGFAPQLTLEAAMAKRGGFAALPPLTGTAGFYVKLLKSEALEEIRIGDAEHSFDSLVEEHFAGLVMLLDEFCDEATAYVPRPYPQFAARFAPYDHLARVKEWSATGGLADSDSGDS
jgi:ATP-dependent helicase/nuclease subunit B